MSKERHAVWENSDLKDLKNMKETEGQQIQSGEMPPGKKQEGIIWQRFPVMFFTALFCCILWGSASPSIKIAYRLFRIGADDTASRIMLAGTRFTLSGCLTILIGSLISRKFLRLTRSSLPKVLVLSLFQTVGQYYFLFMAFANTSGVRGSIINASGNFFAILCAVYIFRLEKMTLQKLAGCIIGFLGITMILGGITAFFAGGGFRLEGEGAMFLGALFYAVAGCLLKIYSRSEDPVLLCGYQFIVGGLILFFLGLTMGGKLVFYTPACWLNLIYMGFISVGAYTLWGILLKYNPVSRVSILGFMNPVMGVLLSALFLNEGREAFSMKGVVAIALVSAGIIIVNAEKRQSPAGD